MQKKKNPDRIEHIQKPFLRGRMIDRGLPGGALKFFGSTLLMVFVYFISMVVADSGTLSIIFSAAILLVTWLIFWQSGMASGTDGVSQGEIMYQRREKGRPVADWELEQCYHPFKGLIVALVGSIPIFVCCLILALIAKRQMTPVGVLPQWVQGMADRPEIAGGLQVYRQEVALELEVVMRIIVHVILAPWVNIVGAENKDAILLLERLGPVLTLIPAAVYGVGYTFGKMQRALVHGNIALGKQKQQKKQRREQRARKKAAGSGPNQLN